MIAYVVSAPPHLRDRISVPKIYWKIAVVLLMPLAAGFFFAGFDAARVVVLSLAASMAAEFAGKSLHGGRTSLRDGSTISLALLFAFLVPLHLSWWMILIGAFVGVFLGKVCFGGTGTSLFHPALVGCAFLELSFPNAMSGTALVDYPAAGPWLAGLLVLAGIILLSQRLYHIEIPLCFLVPLFMLGFFLGETPWQLFHQASIFLAAFFFVTDPATTPLTRDGVRVFALGAALTTVILRMQDLSYWYAFTFSILLMNAFVPWIDLWINVTRSQRGA